MDLAWMAQAPLYIVASPSPRVGKTLIARLLVEFFLTSGRPLVGYDLDPREPELTTRFPGLVTTVDLTGTRGEMALFDRLIAPGSRTTVIDLGYASFDKFFSVLIEIGFVREARQRGIEPVILYIGDTAPLTVRAYAELRAALDATVFVPVHNESVSVMFEKADFAPSRPEFGVIRIPRLSPIVRGVVDRPRISFAQYMQDDNPGGPTEIHSWVRNIFTEFRELELRLLMGKLTASLGSSPITNFLDAWRSRQTKHGT
jgi:hypothetical protein